MHSSVENLTLVQKQIYDKKPNVTIIVVSKTFPIEKVEPLISFGHTHFGENKVQEALQKWSDIKKDNKKIQLHLIGKLQTNKVKFVIPLFDYIHSLDNIKLAEKISNEQKKFKKKLKIFIQVNIGNEIQKNGISLEEIENFYNVCKNKLDLDIIGIMCLPPKEEESEVYFAKMLNLKKKLNAENLSMGMSSDYMKAIENGSNFVRIGSKILGERS